MRLGITLEGIRNPPRWRRPYAEHYAAALELAEEADRLGIDAVAVSEHHLWDDGYLPRPLIFLSAIAARTRRIRLGTAIAILPLYDTASLAEEAAIVDCLSGGRLELGFGAGYRKPEYDAYGRDFRHRFESYEAQITSLRKLWSEGEVTPQPIQDPIPLWAGLRGAKSTYLAGCLGMGRFYLPDDYWDNYLAGLRDGGHDIESARAGGTVQAILADDPEQAFAALAPRIVEHWSAYERYGVAGTNLPLQPPLTAEEYRAIGAFPSREKVSDRTVAFGGGVARARGFAIWTPAEAAAAIRGAAGDRNVDIVYFQAAVTGQIDELSYRSVELIANELRPLLARESTSASAG
jgi:alkanesulfonate monooxygenase SsuD/methylene tetrahydromethanopterin reductase-like flavin-dependent oxidoreductase (luciferase family)